MCQSKIKVLVFMGEELGLNVQLMKHGDMKISNMYYILLAWYLHSSDGLVHLPEPLVFVQELDLLCSENAHPAIFSEENRLFHWRDAIG